MPILTNQKKFKAKKNFDLLAKDFADFQIKYLGYEKFKIRFEEFTDKDRRGTFKYYYIDAFGKPFKIHPLQEVIQKTFRTRPRVEGLDALIKEMEKIQEEIKRTYE